MATVPTYDLPTVALSGGSPGLFETPSAVQPMPDVAGKQLQQQGAAMVTAGAAFSKLASQINYDIADAATKENDNKLSEAYRNILIAGDQSYLNLPGKAAIDGAAPTLKQLQDARQAIEDEIKDPLQLAMFRNVANKRMQVAMSQVDSHRATQAKVYNIGEGKARMNTAVDDASAYLMSNPGAFSMTNEDGKPTGPYYMYKDTAIQEAELLADTMGLPKGSAQRKELIQGVTTKLHGDVIQNFIARDMTPLAQEYYKKFEKEIAPDKRDDLENLIKTNGVKDESLRLSMTLKGSFTENRAAVDKMFSDGKISAAVRDATMTRLEHNFNVANAQRAEFERSLIGSAQEWLINNPDKSVADLPSNMKVGLQKSGQWDNINSFARNGRWVNDPKVWAEVLSLPASELAKMTPDQFYVRYRHKLDDAHLEKGYALLEVNGRGSKNQNLINIVSNNDIVKQAAIRAEIIPRQGEMSDTQAANYALFEETVDARAKAFQQNDLGGKRQPTQEELKRIIDGVLIDQVKIDEWGRDPTKPAFMVAPEERSKMYVVVGDREVRISEINPQDMKRYREAAQARNAQRAAEGKPPIPITTQMLAEMWAAENPSKK